MRILAPSLFAITLALAACGSETEAPAAGETAAPIEQPAPAAPTESADVKPFMIGELQAYALRDGGFQVPNDNKTLAVNKTKAEIDPVLSGAGLSTETLELSVQPLLVKAPDRVLLFDAGAGGAMGPSVGKLSASLASAGVEPAAVTDILISHGHGDHVGGLVTADGALTFPNATIHVSEDEWAALKSNAQMAAAIPVIEPKVKTFQTGAEVVPGVVTAVDIKGHTPGHSGYRITSGDQSLFYIGDTMHHSVISVQRPDWTIAFDGEAPVAEASRKEVLENTAASGERIYAVHFPFPGIGRFEKQGDTFVWVPEQQ